jgi:hypothetical protein
MKGPWPPPQPCFAPRIGEYLARLEQAPLATLLAQPAALARAFRRSTELLGLKVECLDVPATWILHSVGWPATIGEHGIELGPAPKAPRTGGETASSGPLAAVREALRLLPEMNPSPATLLALPSPATLAWVGRGEEWARAVLQAFVRSVGELDLLCGVMFDGDDGVAALVGVLEHYGLAPLCIRRVADTRPAPMWAMVARALPLETLALTGFDRLVTTDGPLAAGVAPEDLLRISRAFARVSA